MKLYSGATQIASQVCPVSGQYLITVSTMSDGIYDITNTLSNALGESSPSPILVLTIDTTLPQAPTITNASALVPTADTTPTII